MKSSCLTTWAVLLKFHTIWIVAAILPGDVVALFAVNACHGDLWADIRALAGHGDSFTLGRGARIPSPRPRGKKSNQTNVKENLVAEAGFEPTTQRL